MKHFILDKNTVIYSKEYNSYHFKTPCGEKPTYIKVSDGLEVENNVNIVKENTFNFIETRFGNLRIIPQYDNSKRALVFATFHGNSYEDVDIDELSKAKVFYKRVYSTSSGVVVNIIAVVSPVKSLIINYTNKLTNKSRVEYVVYNYYQKVIERKTVDADTWSELKEETILRDYDEFNFNKHEVTLEYMKNLTEDEIKRLEEYDRRYNSRVKDA